VDTPFEPSESLDAQVRVLLQRMLEPVQFPGRAELIDQVPRARVVGRRDADCLLEVATDAPVGPRMPKDTPIVIALVDNEPEEVEFFDEPHAGDLELFVRRGRLWALVVSSWCGLDD